MHKFTYVHACIQALNRNKRGSFDLYSVERKPNPSVIPIKEWGIVPKKSEAGDPLQATQLSKEHAPV